MQAKRLRRVHKLTWMESYLPKGAQIKKIWMHSIATGRLVAAFGILSTGPPPLVKTWRAAIQAKLGTVTAPNGILKDSKRTGSSKTNMH